MQLVKISKHQLLESLPDFIYGNCWLAGGAVRDSLLGLTPRDFDIWGPSTEDLDSFILLNKIDEAALISETENAKTYRHAPCHASLGGEAKGNPTGDSFVVQAILKTYSDIEACFKNFDFNICQFAYNGGEDIVCTPDALLDLGKRELRRNLFEPLTPRKIHRTFSLLQCGLVHTDKKFWRDAPRILAKTPIEEIEKHFVNDYSF